MVNYYFGDHTTSIWAELQPSAWILDGGVVLLVAYSLALIATALEVLRVVRQRDEALREWAPAVFAVTLGTIVLVFGFTPFTNQVGLQFWFLIAALHGAAAQRPADADAHARPR
jgi:nitric oxide reductase activation protein